jgi:nickel-dependent lactate racemase
MNEALTPPTIEIRYGRADLAVRVPPGAQATVIKKRPMRKLADPHAAVRGALASPIGSPPFDEVVRGRKSACILICDTTRPVPDHLFLRPLIEGMLAAGVARERVTVLVATGLHRPNEGAELAEVVGDPWVLENVRVENHCARDDAAHVDIGAHAGAWHADEAGPVRPRFRGGMDDGDGSRPLRRAYLSRRQ